MYIYILFIYIYILFIYIYIIYIYIIYIYITYIYIYNTLTSTRRLILQKCCSLNILKDSESHTASVQSRNLKNIGRCVCVCVQFWLQTIPNISKPSQRQIAQYVPSFYCTVISKIKSFNFLASGPHGGTAGTAKASNRPARTFGGS